MKNIKKNLFFGVPMFVITILLFMLRLTHLPAHIVLSVLGIGILVAHTVILKKEWKLPKLEILMRLAYGIAFLTGVVIVNIHGILVLSIIHKLSAVLFSISFIFLLMYNFIKSK